MYSDKSKTTNQLKSSLKGLDLVGVRLNGSSNHEIGPLEHLFSTKFSGLTIDEEYKYNLTYLVSLQNGTTRLPKGHSERRNDRSVERQINGFERKDIKSYCNSSTDKNSYYPNREKNHGQQGSFSRSFSLKSHNHMSVGADRGFGNGDFSPTQVIATSKSNNNMKILRLPSPQKAVVLNNKNFDSPRSGLHLYVNESHPKSNLEETNGYEPHLLLKSSKPSAAYNLTGDCFTKNSTKSKSSSNQIMFQEPVEISKNGKVSQKQDIHGNKQSNNVASRVEAFTALMKPKLNKNSDVVFEAKSPCIYSDNRVIFPDTLDQCFDCGKRIYPVDRLCTGDRVYHKACFRCTTCQRTLLIGNFASLDGIIFCKPHYIEQFRMNAGRYELKQCIDSSST